MEEKWVAGEHRERWPEVGEEGQERGSREDSAEMARPSAGPCRQTSSWVEIRLKVWSCVLVLEGCSLDTRKSVNHFYNERFPRGPVLLMQV